MLFFAYFSSCIHLFHFSAPSTTGSDDDIPTDNCVCMMKFMTNHPNQSWDPTCTSIASFVRIALLAQNETSCYQNREMEAEECLEIILHRNAMMKLLMSIWSSLSASTNILHLYFKNSLICMVPMNK